jgi:hypothetical protein
MRGRPHLNFVLLCYVDKYARLASYKKASLLSFSSSSFLTICGVTLLNFHPISGLLVFLSHALCLERISCGWFADFGWIFLQLGFYALGFLDEVSNFLQFYGMLLM